MLDLGSGRKLPSFHGMTGNNTPSSASPDYFLVYFLEEHIYMVKIPSLHAVLSGSPESQCIEDKRSVANICDCSILIEPTALRGCSLAVGVYWLPSIYINEVLADTEVSMKGT